MADRLSSLRVSRLAILMPALVFFCLLVSFTSLFQYLELKSYDILLRLSPTRPSGDRVVVVGIDDRSIAVLGRLPWDRRVISKLIDRIDAGRPSAIGIDLFFDVPSDTRADMSLAESIRRSGKVVLPAALVSAQSMADPRIPSSHWLRSLPVFEPSAVGHANSSPDSDGICRRIRLSWTVHEKRFWAFSMEIFRVASGQIATPPLERDDSLELGNTTVPARRVEGYEVLIHYPRTATPIRVLSTMDVLSDRWDPRIVKGKAVLIGAVSPLEGDQFFTPVSAAGQPMPGILVHASLVNTLLSRRFLTQSSLPLSLALVVSIVGIVLLLMQWSRSPWQWIGTGIVVAVILSSACLVFWYREFVLPLPTLLFASLTATAVFHIQRLATVRGLLRREVDRLAHQLPIESNVAQLELVANRALGLLMQHSRWEWVDLRFSAGEKELMRRTSGACDGKAPREHLEFVEGEFQARISYPHAISGKEMRLLGFVGRAMAHHLAVFYRDLEVHRGSPGWKEVLKRGADEWQLGVLRQIGARWQTDESSARAVLESISGGILLLDFTGLIQYKNRTAARLLPFLNPDSEEQDLFEALHRHGFINAESAREYPILLPFPDTALEIPLHCKEWPRSDLLLRCSSIHSEEGIHLGAVVAVSDVTDQMRLDAAKSEMIALVAHELRTPMTSIHGFAQQLLRYSMDPERVRRVAETIVRESNRLDQMTRSYLDLSRLEQEALKQRLEPIDLAGITRAAVEAMGAPAESKDIRILFNCPESPIIVRGQAALLERAITNLLSNAIKYSAAATEVEIRVFAADGTGCIAVRDHGVGIPPEALPHVFEKFYRVKSAASSQVPGSGLGLAYVREVATQLGGTVFATSIVKQGSVFELRIPRWRRE